MSPERHRDLQDEYRNRDSCETAWESRPSWYIVAEKDHMIDPAAQREAAKKIKATVTSLPTSHVPMLSRPQDVADVIIAAASSIK